MLTGRHIFQCANLVGMHMELEKSPPTGHGSSSKVSCMKHVSRVAMFVSVFAILFAVMMWDMRKAHMLSIIIHDDHAQQWYAVSQDDLLSWWSPLDICMMGMSAPSMTYAGYRDKNCSRLAASRGSRKLHLSCGAGASLGGSVCQPPFDSRWYFKAALRYDGLGDPHNQYLKTALRRYAQRNRPIIFVGDGISKQNQEALLCEILRTDDVTLAGKSGSVDGNYTIHWPNTRIPPLDVHYLKLTAMNDNGVPKEGGASTLATRLRRKMQRKRAVRVLDGVNATDSSNANKTLASRPLAAPISPLSLTLDEIKGRVQGLMQNHTNGVVLVVNVGVWYNSRELFRTELPDLLSWMDGLSRNHNSTVLFRETAAQHWNHTESGYFDQSYIEQQYDNGTCTPVLDATPEYDWRNEDVRHMLENEDYAQIKMIPFRDLTLPLYNMHPTSASVSVNEEGEAVVVAAAPTARQDCTHYCYFPQMWQGIWMYLYRDALSMT